MISLNSNFYYPNIIDDIASTHKNHESWLIYYYPQYKGKNESVSWYKDFKTLNALTTLMYLNHFTGETISDNELENPNLGLFVNN